VGTMKALLIESDGAALQEMLATMEGGGFAVDCAEDSDSALNHLICKRYEIILLNYAIRDLAGQRLYDRFHGAGLSTPILLIAEQEEAVNKEEIISITKDSILTKPIDRDELLNWSKALIDFTNINVGFMDFPSIVNQSHAGESALKSDKDSKDIELTLAEKKLLGFLLKNRGKTVYKSDILQSVWGSEEQEVFTNIVEVYMTRLRRKLGAHGKSLLNIRGVGYRFEI